MPRFAKIKRYEIFFITEMREQINIAAKIKQPEFFPTTSLFKFEKYAFLLKQESLQTLTDRITTDKQRGASKMQTRHNSLFPKRLKDIFKQWRLKFPPRLEILYSRCTKFVSKHETGLIALSFRKMVVVSLTISIRKIIKHVNKWTHKFHPNFR